MDLIKEIHYYLADEIKEMNSIILKSLDVEEELIQIISNHLSNAGGKRIRPILTILSAKMLGYNGQNAIKLAAAVEFIHMATLLHDDVVDGSKMRRFLPTANVVWGNKASILVGDYLFSQSFKLIVSTKLILALEALSNASAIIAEGEVSQLTKLEQKRLVSEDEYLKIINAKTAELFSAACEVGAIVADRVDVLKNLKNFGLCIGTIFQISDDMLDYFSKTSISGKNIGDDFYEGKVTIPLILLANKLSEKDNTKLNELIKADIRYKDDFLWVIEKLSEYNISSIIADYLKKIRKDALTFVESIDIISNNKSREYLISLIDFAIKRTY